MGQTDRQTDEHESNILRYQIVQNHYQLHPIIALESIFLLLPSKSLAVHDVYFTALQHEAYIDPYGGMTCMGRDVEGGDCYQTEITSRLLHGRPE
jgi:hypothetical protein